MSLYDAIKAIEASRIEPRIYQPNETGDSHLKVSGHHFEREISRLLQTFAKPVQPPHPLFTTTQKTRPQRKRYSHYTSLDGHFALRYCSTGKLSVVYPAFPGDDLREIDLLYEFDDTYVLGEAKIRRPTPGFTSFDYLHIQDYFLDDELLSMVDSILPVDKPIERWLLINQDAMKIINENPTGDPRLPGNIHSYLQEGHRIITVPVAWETIKKETTESSKEAPPIMESW